MSSLFSKLSVAALLAAASASALAAPGNGIRLGGSEGRLHPFIELEGRYDSNAYYTDKAVADFIIHVRPGLKLSVPSEMTTVEASASLDWAHYLGNNDPASKDLSTVYAKANLELSVNPKGTVGFELKEDFDRSDRPRALSFSTALISNYNDLEVRLPWRPGGGAMTLAATGRWLMETYEAPVRINCPSPDVACQAGSLGYNEYRGGLSGAWKFLPRTSALADFEYFNHKAKDATVAATGDTDGWRASAGVNGLVTPHLAATVQAGYGTGSSSNAGVGSISSFLATVEGQWMPTETATVKLGYNRDLRVDPGALYTDDRIYADAKLLMAARFSLSLTGSYESLAYSPGSDTSSIFTVSPSVGVDVTRWLKGELAYAYTNRANSNVLQTDYTKNEIWLKAVATY